MNAAKLALCLTPLLLTGCVIGNSAKLQVSRNVTLGQELTDLKTALDDGSITLSEYESLRGKVFDSADHVLSGNEWTGMMTFDADTSGDEDHAHEGSDEHGSEDDH